MKNPLKIEAPSGLREHELATAINRLGSLSDAEMILEIAAAEMVYSTNIKYIKSMQYAREFILAKRRESE
jgi:hypothetical protein